MARAESRHRCAGHRLYSYALGHSPIPAMADALDAAVRACADRGAVVREIGWPDKFAALAEAQRIVQVFETARAFAIEFEQNRDQLSPPLVALIEEGQSIGTETYLTALRTGRECAGSVDELFGAADIVLAPSAPGEAPRGLHSTGDPQFNRAWHLLGAPQINVPVPSVLRRGQSKLPLGVQMIGRPGDDAGTLSAAHWVEQQLKRASE